MSRKNIGRALIVLLCLAWQSVASTQTPTAHWLGQIGTDHVGRSGTPGPNGVQDLVFEIRGLPADREIERVTLWGYGRDIWTSDGSGGHWVADVRREEGSSRVRVSVEPKDDETGREFRIEVLLSGGQTFMVSAEGGPAQLVNRMPEVSLAARWKGPDGSDRVSPGPSVGPDGIEDSLIELARLDPDAEVRTLTVLAERGPSWSFGPNPDGHHDAMFVRSEDDRTRGMIYLSPTTGLEGRRLRIDLSYDGNQKDRTVLVAGPAPTDRRVRRGSMPEITVEQGEVDWLGQDDRGAVRIEVVRSSRQTIRAAVLSDGVTGSWVYSGAGQAAEKNPLFVGEPRRPLELTKGTRPESIILSFDPYRDEEGTEMTLRLIDEGGHSSILRFSGKACDPKRRFAAPSSRESRVSPGDDLHAVAARGGTIRLRSGAYPLDRPLDLMEPARIIAEPGAELRFQQPEGSVPWAEAIAIRAPGRWSIEGLKIRFEGPVRWDPKAAWGAAIIGVPNLGKRPGGPVHVEVAGLDLEAPLAGSEWEEAPNCFRFLDTESGVISSCELKGGPTILFNGPWRVEENRHRGTQPSTFAGSFLSGRSIRDIEVIGNEVRPEGPSGKLYRFLVLVDRGIRVLVKDNQVVGVGPMDADERPHPNAPEVLLTESYQIRFEGRHAGLSSGGFVMAIPGAQGYHPVVGEVVAVLSGPEAGRWAVIDQVIDHDVFLLDRQLPDGEYDVSITPGFVQTRIEGNLIDCRGSTEGHPVVLTGNHYGTKLVSNSLKGGANAFRLSAYATNHPHGYAWSHTPQFDLLVESNTVVDSHLGGLVSVYHGPQQKTNAGRVYLTGSVLGNTFQWTTGNRNGPESDHVALTIGHLPSIDSGELLLKTGRNAALDARGQAVSNPMQIRVGTVNGQTYEPSND